MKPTVAPQIATKHQFERFFAKYHRLVYCTAYSVTGNLESGEAAEFMHSNPEFAARAVGGPLQRQKFVQIGRTFFVPNLLS